MLWLRSAIICHGLRRGRRDAAHVVGRRRRDRVAPAAPRGRGCHVSRVPRGAGAAGFTAPFRVGATKPLHLGRLVGRDAPGGDSGGATTESCGACDVRVRATRLQLGRAVHAGDEVAQDIEERGRLREEAVHHDRKLASRGDKRARKPRRREENDAASERARERKAPDAARAREKPQAAATRSRSVRGHLSKHGKGGEEQRRGVRRRSDGVPSMTGATGTTSPRVRGNDRVARPTVTTRAHRRQGRVAWRTTADERRTAVRPYILPCNPRTIKPLPSSP